MSNSEQFINASKIVNNLSSKPTNDELCQLYGLYKQAINGNNTTPKPSMFDLKANKKWSAWMDNINLSTFNAEVKYITLVNTLIQKYQLNKQ
jgi:diazepam-binding inhibitor (GABA receptor modulating acyl-CoA-binding protein)